MFDVGWSELVVIGVVALVVIGPKELPGVIRNVGRAVGKLRTMAGDFRAQFDEAMREADLQDVQKTFTDAKDTAMGAYSAATNPVGAIKDEIASSVTSINESAKSLEAEMKGEKPAAAPLPLVDLPALPELPPVVIPPPEAVVAARQESAPQEPAKPKRTRRTAEAPVVEEAEPAPKPRRARKKAADEGTA